MTAAAALERVFFLLLASVVLSAAGCGFATKALVGSLSDETALEVYSSDDDPELVRDALPFALKTYEMLIARDPGNRDLCLAAAAGFVQYASAFLDDEAERLKDEDFEASRALRRRAAGLYERGQHYALRGIEVDHPHFGDRIREDAAAALTGVSERDVPLLFWAGAGWAGAISSDPSNMGKMAELSAAEAVMRRALELDEDFDDGAVHEFFISFDGGRSEAMGGSAVRAREHYRRAVELSGGKKASPHVALAATVLVREQDIEGFRSLLDRALAVDPDGVRKWRLSNTLARRKARRLLGRLPELFVEYEEGDDD